MLWKDLLMCHVRITITFIVTDRQNKSIITITSQQLIQSVCCSASHRQRYGDILIGLSVWGVRVNIRQSGVPRLKRSFAVTACRGSTLP